MHLAFNFDRIKGLWIANHNVYKISVKRVKKQVQLTVVNTKTNKTIINIKDSHIIDAANQATPAIEALPIEEIPEIDLEAE